MQRVVGGPPCQGYSGIGHRRNYKVDKKSKALLGHVKLETRGLVYIDEVKNTHRSLIKKSKELYENTVKDVPDMEEKDFYY